MRLFEHCYRIINKYNQKTQKPRCYGTEDMLYAAQVHTLDVIGSYGEVTTTSLAQLLGVTKGAISQTTSRLFSMGLIEKKTSSVRKTEILISLSEKGKIVFDCHREKHREAQEKIDEILGTLPDESISAVNSVIRLVEEMIDNI